GPDGAQVVAGAAAAAPPVARGARLADERGCRAYRAGRARHEPDAGGPRLAVDRQGRGGPGAGQPRRGAHPVRHRAQDRGRHPGGAAGDVPPGPDQLRAARVPAGAGRPRLARPRRAAEVALTAGDYTGARELLDRIVQTYPTHPRADFARINRAVLLLRTGDAAGARKELTEWLARKPFPALTGRVHAALAAAQLGAGDIPGAQKELIVVQHDGLGAFAAVGTGIIALRQKKWDDAARPFEEARDAGTPDIVAAAEYGPAVVRF